MALCRERMMYTLASASIWTSEGERLHSFPRWASEAEVILLSSTMFYFFIPPGFQSVCKEGEIMRRWEVSAASCRLGFTLYLFYPIKTISASSLGHNWITSFRFPCRLLLVFWFTSRSWSIRVGVYFLAECGRVFFLPHQGSAFTVNLSCPRSQPCSTGFHCFQKGDVTGPASFKTWPCSWKATDRILP